MDEEFYSGMELNGGGGGGGNYYDYGGGYDFNYPTIYGDFMLNYSVEPIDYAPGFEPGTGEVPFAPYEPGVLNPPTFEPLPTAPSGGGDLFGAYFDYYSAQGYDDYTAMQMAAQDAAAGSIQTITEAPYVPPTLPETPWPFYELPYIPEPFLTPYTPTFPEPPAPPPPTEPLPPSPASQQPGLPPYCPAGQYHPYPIGHPQQNICVPFPSAPTQQPRPPAQQQPSPPPQAPRPRQQQQQQQPCPPGYKRDPWTLQCVPIAPQRQPQQPTGCPAGYYRAPNGQCSLISRCASPGTVFDQATGRCVLVAQALSPLPGSEAPDVQLPEGAGDMLSELKKLPWWLWVALGGLLLLGRGGEERKRVTIQHRRAS